MRIKTYALGITASLGLTVAWFAGCGGTVAQNQGVTTTGSGGAITTTTVSSSTTSSGTTTATMTTSMTMTGTSPCDMACAHIAMCIPGITCATVGVDCSTVGTQFDCVANCAAATPCAQLGAGTIQKCQAQCAGDAGAADAGAADAGDGGMTINACSTCVGTNCATGSVAACALDATCLKWLGCVAPCNMASPPVVSCFQACDTMYASAHTLYDPVYACTCNKCGTECAASDACQHGMDGGP